VLKILVKNLYILNWKMIKKFFIALKISKYFFFPPPQHLMERLKTQLLFIHGRSLLSSQHKTAAVTLLLPRSKHPTC